MTFRPVAGRARGPRLRALRGEDLTSLPGCSSCPSLQPGDPGVRAALQAWGWCGLVAVAGERPVGHLLLTPEEDQDGRVVARVVALHPSDGTPDADGWTSSATVRRLLEGAAARLLRRRVVALEATAHRWAGSCPTPSLGVLAARGFVVVREHPLHPLMRMELDRTVPGEPVLQTVWRRLTELVRSPPPPEPVGFTPTRETRAVGV
ncbi:hypothetical protein [Auraticoccus monumenti]|uniref:N-acetyltransferase domain-containing protein n=1 Tax=Auraticoccus monumenti TaxID=675864 RepID=A0A1G6UA84_9ACTN|nr:hypothetical protein [Auraticoccus monumenti]SDD37465.1 hypothetical protein SAMN04489747_0818 [Auraticoccus monumenti]